MRACVWPAPSTRGDRSPIMLHWQIRLY